MGYCKTFLSSLLLLIVLVSCVPGGSSDSTSSSGCADGEVFNTTTKTCASGGSTTVATSTPPSPTTTSATIVEDSTSNSISISYTDADGDLASACVISSYSTNLDDDGATAPTCSCSSGSCSMTVTPDDNYYGSTSTIVYTLTDGKHGTSSAQTLTLTVSNVNDTPVLNEVGAPTMTVTEDVALVGTVGTDANLVDTTTPVTDADYTTPVAGTNYLFSVVTAPSNGTLSLAADGSYTFTPTANYNGADTFSYKVTDDASVDSNTSTVTVTINAVQDAPIPGADQAVAVTEDTGTTFTANTATDVESTDTDIVYSVVTVPTKGVLSECMDRDSDGQTIAATTDLTCTYTPYNDQTGVDTLVYKATDTDGTDSATNATITFTISEVNDAPIASNGLVTFAESSSGFASDAGGYTFDLSTVLTSTDVDSTDANITYTFNSATLTNGVVTNCLNASGSAGTTDTTCTYTVNTDDGNSNGSGTAATIDVDSITYTAKYVGTSGNNIKISVVDDPRVVTAGTDESVKVVNDGTNILITINIRSGTTTRAQVCTAVQNSTTALYYINDPSGDGDCDATAASVASGTLATGTQGFDTMTILASDNETTAAVTAAPYSLVNIDMTEANDAPVVCAYSDYKDAPECGLTGCYGTASPSGTITPSSHTDAKPVQYYDSSSATCWYSTSTSAWARSTASCSYSAQGSAANQEPNCSAGGCTGTGSPSGSLEPSNHALGTITYWDSAGYKCYQSTGTSNTSWQLVTATIRDYTINEKDEINIRNLVIDEGGSDTTEDTETVTIQNLASSNTTLINTANIKFYYTNSGSSEAAYTLGVANGDANSEDEDRYRIEVTPTGGQTGSSTITFDVVDSNGTPLTTNIGFTVTVNPVSATHNDWTIIQAHGPKVDKIGGKESSATLCPYTRLACNTRQDCSGTTAPGTGTAVVNVTADSTTDDTIYYDTDDNKCYYWNTSSVETNKWTEITNYCNISPSSLATECSGNSCLEADAATITALTPSAINNYYRAIDTGVCYRSVDTNDDGTADSFTTYSATGKVKLSWSSLTISGSGTLSGYNLYRRLIDESFDYTRPVNLTTISSSDTTFTDMAGNSWEAPVPGTVYIYELRPIINSIETAMTESYAKIRVLVPSNNRSFVHRRIANRSICEKMDLTLDKTNENRCTYTGPGDNTSGYYDVGSDFVVDTYEAGCPYTTFDCAETSDTNCIGIVAPSGNITATAANIIYYNRSSGICYRSTAAGTGSWVEYDLHGTPSDFASSTTTNYSDAGLPPLVYATQSSANSFCAGTTSVQNILGSDVYGTTSQSRRLPTRKEQIAYSTWDTEALTDTSIANYEAGSSLDVSSKCNTNSADGLTSGYSDSESPSSTALYSLPGTSSSNIRSMASGSTETDNCVSRTGLKEVIGNVYEWTSDLITCFASTTEKTDAGTAAAGSSCRGVTGDDAVSINGAYDFSVRTSTATSSALYNDADGTAEAGADDGALLSYRIGNNQETDADPFATDGYPVGPCIDADSDDTCDTAFSSAWGLSDESYNAGTLNLATGMPGHKDFATNYSSDPAASAFVEIGSTLGITSANLRNDTIYLNSATIAADVATAGGIAGGGSYLTGGGGAGLWHFKVHPRTDAGGNENIAVDIGFRCVAPISSSFYEDDNELSSL